MSSYVSGGYPPGNGYANRKGIDYRTKHMLYDAACRCEDLFPHAKLVLGNLIFKHYRSDTGLCEVSEQTIARQVGTNTRQVRRAIRQLREQGWIGVQRRYNKTSLYSFAWDRAVAPGTVEPPARPRHRRRSGSSRRTWSQSRRRWRPACRRRARARSG